MHYGNIMSFHISVFCVALYTVGVLYCVASCVVFSFSVCFIVTVLTLTVTFAREKSNVLEAPTSYLGLTHPDVISQS